MNAREDAVAELIRKVPEFSEAVKDSDLWEVPIVPDEVFTQFRYFVLERIENGGDTQLVSRCLEFIESVATDSNPAVVDLVIDSFFWTFELETLKRVWDLVGPETKRLAEASEGQL